LTVAGGSKRLERVTYTDRKALINLMNLVGEAGVEPATSSV